MDAEVLVLADGVRVVGLGHHLLQVGLEHPGAVRLARTPAIEQALDALATGMPLPDDATAREVAAELVERGLAVRRSCPPLTVGVVGAVGEGALDPVPLLEASGLAWTRGADGADVVLLLSCGELDRDLLTPVVRHQQPHLPVRLVDGLAVVGPFAVPGRSACLRCVDLHRAAEDAAHLLLVDRYARAAVGPPDPALATLATAWAVRDLTTWAAGGCPSTWSRTVRLDPALADVAAQAWWRHPDCGCTWGEGPSATMGA
ncbi:MAG TPA: hypothetical protein VFM09_11365 [Marmoricola sp.]|nr:hypothetical protein [Marmoricola sp.]